MGGRSRRGFLFSSKILSYNFECIQVLCYGWTLPSKTPSSIFECIEVLCYGWTLLQGLFVFFKKTVLYFLVYTSHVLRVDAPAGAFCFLQTHLLMFLIQVVCYRWTLPQGLFVLFKNTVLCVGVYTCPVLRMDVPAGAF